MFLTNQGKWKVTYEESLKSEKDYTLKREKWRYAEIKGKRGLMYPYSKNEIAVYVQSATIINRFKRIKGLKLIRDGDDEAVFLVGDGLFDYVANQIKAPKMHPPLTGDRKKRFVKAGEVGRQKIRQRNKLRAKRRSEKKRPAKRRGRVRNPFSSSHHLKKSKKMLFCPVSKKSNKKQKGDRHEFTKQILKTY